MEEKTVTLNENVSADMISFEIIANAGDCRSYAFQALNAAKAGNFTEAEDLMKKAEQSEILAHRAQTKLLNREMNGEHTDVNVLLVHSQDHLMNGMLARELIQELIELYRSRK